MQCYVVNQKTKRELQIAIQNIEKSLIAECRENGHMPQAITSVLDKLFAETIETHGLTPKKKQKESSQQQSLQGICYGGLDNQGRSSSLSPKKFSHGSFSSMKKQSTTDAIADMSVNDSTRTPSPNSSASNVTRSSSRTPPREATPVKTNKDDDKLVNYFKQISFGSDKVYKYSDEIDERAPVRQRAPQSYTRSEVYDRLSLPLRPKQQSQNRQSYYDSVRTSYDFYKEQPPLTMPPSDVYYPTERRSYQTRQSTVAVGRSRNVLPQTQSYSFSSSQGKSKVTPEPKTTWRQPLERYAELQRDYGFQESQTKNENRGLFYNAQNPSYKREAVPSPTIFFDGETLRETKGNFVSENSASFVPQILEQNAQNKNLEVILYYSDSYSVIGKSCHEQYPNHLCWLSKKRCSKRCRIYTFHHIKSNLDKLYPGHFKWNFINIKDMWKTRTNNSKEIIHRYRQNDSHQIRNLLLAHL